MYWLEEPVVSKDYENMAAVKSRSGNVKIACGENYYRKDFADALKYDVFDILQPDVTKCGGITEMVKIAVKIANMARIWSKEWAPHYYGGGLGLAACLQVMDAVPDGLMMEFPHNESVLRNGILETKIEIIDGHVEVPSMPGLGVVLDEKVMNSCRIDR